MRLSDVFSKKKRSQVMAAVRSEGNRATEIKLVAILRSFRISGWRRHCRLTGCPEFLFWRELDAGISYNVSHYDFEGPQVTTIGSEP
jgi:G:T-mismatch repair DNA endonuclease (very short patch repair protein)